MYDRYKANRISKVAREFTIPARQSKLLGGWVGFDSDFAQVKIINKWEITVYITVKYNSFHLLLWLLIWRNLLPKTIKYGFSLPEVPEDSQQEKSGKLWVEKFQEN